MQALTDQAGSTTIFIYDPRGLLHYRMDPFEKTSIYSYYDDGRLHTREDRNGDLLTYSYTPGGKVESINDPDSSRVEFRYDLRDNVVEMEDSIGTTAYAYDGANRLIRTTNPRISRTPYLIQEEFKPNLRKRSLDFGPRGDIPYKQGGEGYQLREGPGQYEALFRVEKDDIRIESTYLWESNGD